MLRTHVLVKTYDMEGIGPARSLQHVFISPQSRTIDIDYFILS